MFGGLKAFKISLIKLIDDPNDNYGNILSHFFDKNFVKVKKILESI